MLNKKKKENIKLKAYLYIMHNDEFKFLQKYVGTKEEIEKECNYLHMLTEQEVTYKIQYDTIN